MPIPLRLPQSLKRRVHTYSQIMDGKMSTVLRFAILMELETLEREVDALQKPSA